MQKEITRSDKNKHLQDNSMKYSLQWNITVRESYRNVKKENRDIESS